MSESLINLPTFEYHDVHINDIQCLGAYNDKGVFVVDKVLFKDREVVPTGRFWNSLCSRFQISPSFFSYFTHEEVFNRVSHVLSTTRKRDGGDMLKVCIQKDPAEDEEINPETGYRPKLVGVTKPNKNMLQDHEAMEILGQLNPEHAEYRDGIILTRHSPRQDFPFTVGPDDFNMKLSLEIPIDGYGDPAVFLSLLREVCVNGQIAYAKAFRSGITLGKKDSAQHTVLRVMESFSNEDGFIALKQRMSAAQTSHASLHEAFKLGKELARLGGDDFKSKFVTKMAQRTGGANVGADRRTLRGDLLKSYWELCGDPRAMYGVAQLEAISEKRMKALPVGCTVYDLLNFATEVATHQLEPNSARRIQGFYGTMVSSEYDLEDSKTELGEFSDFICPNSKPEVDRLATVHRTAARN
jgi:hypothetical protein